MLFMNQVQQEIARLYQEHTRIAGNLEPKIAIARERLVNPGKVRAAAAYIASYLVPAHQALEAHNVITVGPMLYPELGQLQSEYEDNLQEAIAHKDEHLDEYLNTVQAL
jgi:hypothetical protein